MKIIAFGASNSRKSINKRFANWAAGQTAIEYELLDLNEYEMPIFSVDREAEFGIHPKAIEFRNKLKEADGIIISFAEHNGGYTAAFKNIFDWFSRISSPRWMEKPMLLLSTSPGKRGAKTVLDVAVRTFPHQGARVIEYFSLPNFKENFNEEDGITNPILLSEFKSKLQIFIGALEKDLPAKPLN